MHSKLLEAIQRIHDRPTYATYVALSNLLESYTDADLETLSLAIIRNFTIEPVLPVIKGELVLAGFFPDLYVGDFDTIAADTFNSESALYHHHPDLIIIMQWLETLSPSLSSGFLTLSPDQKETEIDRIVQGVVEIIRTLRKKTSVPILINNFPLPNLPTLGILDPQSEQYQTYSLIRLNMNLLNALKQFADIYWINFFGLFSRIGYEQAMDERYWQIARAPLSQSLLVPLGKEYGKFVKALRSKVKKCLVLDCDNTLWGGIIGEDGMSGIALGDSHPGSSYMACQKEILNLYHRGVILALCSRNNEDDVLEVLRNHPEMVLQEKHFATWQINWDDKTTNLKRIAQDLNIGIDSLVFVDDNAFECEMVKQQLPQVTTLHLKGDAFFFRRLLSEPGYFDSLIFSSEDRKRTEMYASDRQRKQLVKSTASLEDYFMNLKLEAEIGIPGNNEIARVAQLTQKTNQFNLTTRRYSEGKIRVLTEAPTSEVYYLKLSDRISDLGLIGVAILRFFKKSTEIDTFLLSCRALGRHAESVLLNFIINQSIEKGANRIVGKYLPTKKNSQVTDFYLKQGFIFLKECSNETESVFELQLGKNKGRLYPRWVSVTIKGLNT